MPRHSSPPETSERVDPLCQTPSVLLPRSLCVTFRLHLCAALQPVRFQSFSAGAMGAKALPIPSVLSLIFPIEVRLVLFRAL